MKGDRKSFFFNSDYALGIVMRSKIAINQGFSSEKHSTAMVTG